MHPSDLLRVALESLRANKLRSFLTLLGIIIGVTTLVGVAAVISGLEAFVQERVIVLAPDVFVVTKFGIITSHDDFLRAIRRPDLDFRDHAVLAARLQRAEAVGADVGTGAPVKYRGRRLPDVRIHGTTANYGTLLAMDLEAGRFFTETDERSGRPVAVIGWDIRDELYGGLDPIGREIVIGSGSYQVVGVVARQGRTLGQSQDDQVWVPLGAFRRAYGRRNSLDILVKARGGVPGVESSVDEVRSVLRGLRHTGFRDDDPFGVITAENLQQLWRQISTSAFVLTLLISGVSLGIGGVVIANIMLVGVVERTREIGVRLAVGARKRDIRRQFLLEAALLSTAGGVIGILVGGGVAAAVEAGMHFPTRLTPLVIVAALALSCGVGLVAGWWPARSASNLPVVDALRDET
ncbi:MAG TPA: ABC transporter permease [Candidatus Polarisedimenticolaceae bacterium]|nr:ABC transporter permease [Candidatus Polarisedimenticolaceae bacterium]